MLEHPRPVDVALVLVEAFAVGLPHVKRRPRDRASPPSPSTVPVTKQGMPGAPSAMLPPFVIEGALGTWNGPSIVLGVALPGRRWLIASTSMLTPSTSEPRMNSCRFSEHRLPVRASQSTATAHSACVGFPQVEWCMGEMSSNGVIAPLGRPSRNDARGEKTNEPGLG